MSKASAPSVGAYLESWGLELAARQNRVRLLIGDAHWLSDGHHKEAILRDFLKRYLPNEAVCSTGFIRSASEDKHCSREVDILIYSGRLHLPYFFEGGVSIVDPASVLATLEIKSSYSASALKDALENIKLSRALTMPEKLAAENLWSGIFFYELAESRTLESAVETLAATLTEVLDPDKERNLYPTCVVLGKNCLAFPATDGTNVRIRAFERVDWGFACAICDLFSSIISQVDGLKLSGFEEWGSSGTFKMLDKTF